MPARKLEAPETTGLLGIKDDWNFGSIPLEAGRGQRAILNYIFDKSPTSFHIYL